MSLNFGSNPQVYHSGTYNPTIDPTVDGGAHWAQLAPQRWGVFNDGLGPHPLAHDGDSVVHLVRAQSADGTLPADVEKLLRERLKWDGVPLTYLEAADLNRLTDPWSGKPWSVTINNIVGAIQTVPSTPPPQPTAPAIQGSELWETVYNVTSKFPKGTAIWRCTGSLETAFTGINAMIAQAGAGDPASGVAGDNVETFAEQLVAARSGMFEFFFAAQAAYDAGRDYLLGSEVARAQLGADAVWNTIHYECRKQWMGMKQSGWVLVAGDPRPTVFKWSRLNRIAWTILSNVTTACGLYGIRGELTVTGQRDAFYVDPFMSWESQDPLRPQTTGSDGIGIGGQSFADGVRQ